MKSHIRKIGGDLWGSSKAENIARYQKRFKEVNEFEKKTEEARLKLFKETGELLMPTKNKDHCLYRHSGYVKLNQSISMAAKNMAYGKVEPYEDGLTKRIPWWAK